MTDKYYSNFHIAGFTYYNGVDVFEKLKIGVQLRLRAEPKNRYDPKAIAIYYKEAKIGYVPKTENEMLSKFLNLGYTDMFEVKINQVVPEAYPEHQIRVVVRIRDKN